MTGEAVSTKVMRGLSFLELAPSVRSSCRRNKPSATASQLTSSHAPTQRRSTTSCLGSGTSAIESAEPVATCGEKGLQTRDCRSTFCARVRSHRFCHYRESCSHDQEFRPEHQPGLPGLLPISSR